MKVLVTGATGFLGRRVVPLLVEAGYEVHAPFVEAAPPTVAGVTWHSADLLAAPEALVKAVRPNELVHLAWYAEHGKFWASPENLPWVGASLRLFKAFAESGGRRVTVAGSCAEYAWGAGHPLDERAPTAPSTLYGVAKDATRRVLEAYATIAGLSWSWGRIFLLHGPDEDPRRFVSSVIDALADGRVAEMSHGAQVRDFLHVEDVAGALVAMHRSSVEGAVNLGSGVGVTLLGVAEAIRDQLGGELRPGARAAAPDDPAVLRPDVTRLRDEVGFVPKYDAKESLRRTIQGRLALRAQRTSAS